MAVGTTSGGAPQLVAVYKNYFVHASVQERHRYPGISTEALEMLIKSGTNADAQQALVGGEFRPALDYKKEGEVNEKPFATWGEKIQCADYNAWEIAFGNLQFVAIGMGIQSLWTPVYDRR